MGADFPTDINSNYDPKKRAPTSKPPFTMRDLKRAIPPHCFERSLLRSFSYIIYDLTGFFAVSYLAANYIPMLPQPLRYLAWPLYWFISGTVMTGLANIGHECGHQAFSNYSWVDDTVGFILGSILMTPYYAFKYTHNRHHSNTGSADYEEVLVPRRKDALSWFDRIADNMPGRIFKLTLSVALGWPLYLAINASGRTYGNNFASHFYPSSPMFAKDSHRLKVFFSDIGVAAFSYGLYRLALVKSTWWVFSMYIMPFLVSGGWLATIGLLNHTSSALPKYDASEWNWLRGTLSTVDRDYGIFNVFLHHVTDGHVMHHLFSHMPHYHTIEATKAAKPILGEYYQFDETPILKAMYRETKECIFLEPQAKKKGVYWFSNDLKS